VCRIKEQNVGWDEFGTYDVKGGNYEKTLTGKIKMKVCTKL